MKSARSLCSSAMIALGLSLAGCASTPSVVVKMEPFRPPQVNPEMLQRMPRAPILPDPANPGNTYRDAWAMSVNYEACRVRLNSWIDTWTTLTTIPE